MTSQSVASRPKWQRALWLSAGALSLGLGVVGIALPLLPTVPFVLLAAWCFSRGCMRCERWLLEHPRFGPHVRAWRANRAVPPRAKKFSIAMMAGSCAIMWWVIPPPWAALPTLFCAGVALWLWRLPSTPPEQGLGG